MVTRFLRAFSYEYQPIASERARLPASALGPLFSFLTPRMKLHLAGAVNHAEDVIKIQLNVEHRTPNIERPMLTVS